MEEYGKLSLNCPCYPLLSEHLVIECSCTNSIGFSLGCLSVPWHIFRLALFCESGRTGKTWPSMAVSML